MKFEKIKFISTASNLRVAGSDRVFILAAAVAASVADFMPVPSTPVESASAEFSRNVAMLAGDEVNSFNEAVPFDMRMALELVRKFWTMRYETVHVRRSHDFVEGDYFAGYFNKTRNFSTEEIATLNQFSAEINLVEIAVRECLSASKKEREALNARAATAPDAAVATVTPAVNMASI